jgi:hypothetical protein
MLYLRHGIGPHASGKTAAKAIEEGANLTATGELPACCDIKSLVINRPYNNADDTGTRGQDMPVSKTANVSKSKEPLILKAQPVDEELDRDQFSGLDSSEAPANDVESDIDSEVVEPVQVTKNKKGKAKAKAKDRKKDKAPTLNLRDEIRANCKKIPNSGGHLEVKMVEIT